MSHILASLPNQDSRWARLPRSLTIQDSVMEALLGSTFMEVEPWVARWTSDTSAQPHSACELLYSPSADFILSGATLVTQLAGCL